MEHLKEHHIDALEAKGFRVEESAEEEFIYDGDKPVFSVMKNRAISQDFIQHVVDNVR